MQIVTFTIVRNMEHTIGLMIKSVFWADKIIVYDDNSTDRTVEVIESFATTEQYRDKIVLLRSRKKATIFEVGELEERNRLLKMIFESFIFDFIVLIDADEILSKNLRSSIIGLDRTQYDKVAFSCYHVFSSNEYLHFYSTIWNNVSLIDPHVRVLSSFQEYEVGAWSDVKHPWMKYDSTTKCLNDFLHFHLKYLENSPYLNSSLPFLPKKVDRKNAEQYLRFFDKDLPLDIQQLLT